MRRAWRCIVPDRFLRRHARQESSGGSRRAAKAHRASSQALTARISIADCGLKVISRRKHEESNDHRHYLIILIVLGLVGLVVQGVTYTSERNVVDVAGMKVTAEEKKTVPIPPTGCRVSNCRALGEETVVHLTPVIFLASTLMISPSLMVMSIRGAMQSSLTPFFLS